jgi:hypothetical protein
LQRGRATTWTAIPLPSLGTIRDDPFLEVRAGRVSLGACIGEPPFARLAADLK